MTLLGKLLILFNLLAAGGFLYLATQDWKGRQTINAAAIRHKLLLVGLPFEGPDTFNAEDETPFRIEMAGSAYTETISKKILELYFQAVTPGDPATSLSDKTPVPCQLAEVKRVKAKIESLLKDKDATEKTKLLKDWLIDQSETYDQRLEIKNLAAAENSTELEKRLMALFDAILIPSPSEPISKIRDEDGADDEKNREKIAKVEELRNKPLDLAERQIRVAELLTHLSPDAAWQKRVVMVVGLRRYVSAISTQANRFRDMSARLESLIITDQVGFLAELANFNQMARDHTDLANRQSKLKAEKVEQLKKEDDFIAQRKTQLMAIETQLLKIKAEVDESLVKQAQIEAGLFEVQREVAITLDEVYQLESKLAARERELLKLNPVPNAP